MTNDAEEAQRARDHWLDSGSVFGLRYQYPWADSAAVYRVVSASPFTVQHVAVCDAWSVPESYIRGLRLDDVIKQNGLG